MTDGREFENTYLVNCNEECVGHEFSASKTTQENRVVERKNMTLQEVTCVMLNSKKLPMKLWE